MMPSLLRAPVVHSVRRWLQTAAVLAVLVCGTPVVAADPPGADDEPTNVRPPASEEDLRYWLENMYVYHGFAPAEMSAATGLSADEVRSAVERFGLRREDRPRRRPGDPLVVLPYPGGRHPRLGFLDGAVRPQRETKFSVFTPWDPDSYVVADIPEAIWSNLGLTYLAHTHVPTVWTKQGVELERLEWERRADGTLYNARRLPNGIRFAVTVTPKPDTVQMDISLTNGTDQLLTGLRNQMCVMLGYAASFNGQTNDNKVYRHPYVACRSEDGNRWIITAWEPCLRLWANPRCPCMHSDPQLPDCPPGKTVTARGYLWFYEGEDLDAELARLVEKTGWPLEGDWPGPPGPRPARPARK